MLRLIDYVRTGVSAYANMKSDEQFEITSDEHLIDAIMWTLHVPSTRAEV